MGKNLRIFKYLYVAFPKLYKNYKEFMFEFCRKGGFIEGVPPRAKK